jgi:hypothetical protein
MDVRQIIRVNGGMHIRAAADRPRRNAVGRFQAIGGIELPRPGMPLPNPHPGRRDGAGQALLAVAQRLLRTLALGDVLGHSDDVQRRPVLLAERHLLCSHQAPAQMRRVQQQLLLDHHGFAALGHPSVAFAEKQGLFLRKEVGIGSP